MRTPRTAHVAIVLAALAGGALLASPPSLLAADETPAEAVERLLPALDSDVDDVRRKAEAELFALGPDGRQALEGLARSNDTKRAIMALRLLQRPEWSHSERGERELRLRDAQERLDDMDRRFEEMQRRIRESLSRRFEIEIPQALEDLRNGTMSGSSQGSIRTEDETFEWSKASDGRVKVTITRKDEEPKTYEAPSVEELRKSEPDVAARLDEVLVHNGATRFRFHLPRGLLEWQGELEKGWDDLGRRKEVEDARKLAERLLRETHGAVSQIDGPMLGIHWTPPADVLAEQLDLPEGAMVIEDVVEGSLAAKLGIERHDILLELNGRAVTGSASVQEILGSVKEGQALTALVVRKTKQVTLETTR